MATELITGLQIFKTMLDMAKGLKDMNDAAARNTAVIELQGSILGAQEAQSALVQRVGELEKEVTRFETWETEKQRYKLTDFGGGTFAYAMKEEMSDGEPLHRICAHCYEEGHKSILQFKYNSDISGQDVYNCVRCKTQFEFGVQKDPLDIEPRSESWVD